MKSIGFFLFFLLATFNCLADTLLQSQPEDSLKASRCNSVPTAVNRHIEPQRCQSQECFDFRNRQSRFQEYVKSSSDAYEIQAELGLEIDLEFLRSDLITNIKSQSKADFKLTRLIRILFSSNGQYDDEILTGICDLNFQLTPGEKLQGYWSENHMIMWLSSAWLLQERVGWDMPVETRERLLHFLNLKVQYGYYEFFSTTYLPHTLAPLLNLADYAIDAEIQAKARLAATRLLKDIVLVTNEQGVWRSASGRYRKGDSYTQDKGSFFDLVSLILGQGTQPKNVEESWIGVLGTTHFDPSDAIRSYRSQLSETITIGHSINDMDIVHHGISEDAKALFQLSSGGWFHPTVVDDTLNYIDQYELWDHKDFHKFGSYKALQGLLKQIPPDSFIFNLLRPIVSSSNLSGVTMSVWKNKNSTLTSLQDYYPGYVGAQQMPWVANVGGLSVFTQVGTHWKLPRDEKPQLTNAHLPYIKQKDNIALIMFKPHPFVSWFKKLLNFDNTGVNLHFPEEDFDETAHKDNWSFGREGESYIAVYKACKDKRAGIFHCDSKRLLYVVISGDEDIYGSFDDFKNRIINDAKVRNNRKFNLNHGGKSWRASVTFDGKEIKYVW